ncbi:MAG: hypothetical protein AAB781_00305 [Patescibacteria group bacterium]
MNIRIILTLIGLATGWFLFEEIIIGAIVFITFGVIVWFGHKKKQKSYKVRQVYKVTKSEYPNKNC